MKRIPLGPLHYEFSRHFEPRIWLAPGETLVVESEDAFSGQIRKAGDRRDKTKQPLSNPLTGPICVRGAEPGDALAVTIHAIEPLIDQCATRTGEARQLSEWLGDDCPHGAHVCRIADGLIHWGPGVTIPYAPMLGCLGTGPAGGAATSLAAGLHGGNMDLVEVAPGNTVYLPVFLSGGFLYLGDAHAAMGHGELSGSGLEMPAATTISVDVVKKKQLVGPRIESPGEIMTVVTGTPMERSLAHAYAELILWMESDFGWDRWQAYDLMTHVGRISIGWYSLGTVAAAVPRRYLGR